MSDLQICSSSFVKVHGGTKIEFAGEHCVGLGVMVKAHTIRYVHVASTMPRGSPLGYMYISLVFSSIALIPLFSRMILQGRCSVSLLSLFFYLFNVLYCMWSVWSVRAYVRSFEVDHAFRNSN